MAISLLAYVAIFSGSFIFGKTASSQVLRVTFFKVSQELLFRSGSFFRADAFFEELYFQCSHFFPAFFPQNIYLFRAKLLTRNQILRKGNSLVQLPFRTAQLPTEGIYRRATFSKQILLHNINFSKKRKILKKATFSE